jgi:peptidoglycan-associated lipoprotein
MYNRAAGFFVVLCCGALLAGGCAKKEIVKGEEPITSAVKPSDAAPAKPSDMAQPQTVQEAAIVKEEPGKAMEQAVAEAALGKIYFDFDSFVLSQEARDTLKKNAEYLQKKNLSARIQIEGNCDERGSSEYNLALGEKRAKAALNYLVTLGVAADRLSFISYGEEKPADPGHDEAAWSKNRRAEFLIIK